MINSDNQNQHSEEQKNTDKICPYMGLQVDPHTCFQFPSTGNYCHNTDPPRSIDMDYQYNTCLTSSHIGCVIYKSDGWKGSFPSDIGAAYTKKNKNVLRNILALIILLIIITGGAYLFFSGIIGNPLLSISQFSNSLQPTQILQSISPTPTSTATASSTAITQSTSPYSEILLPTSSDYTLDKTPIVILTPTPIPTFTPTPYIPTLGPDMATPFGPGNRFILYTVQSGESLPLIAQTFQTTVAVIRASNILIEGASVWPGTVLIILPGETNTEKLPRYSAILVEHPTDIEIISEEYDTTPEMIRLLNQLGENDIIPAQRWIIIQVEERE